jgi:hypothetical protein
MAILSRGNFIYFIVRAIMKFNLYWELLDAFFGVGSYSRAHSKLPESISNC